jgi:hypothetical protein
MSRYLSGLCVAGLGLCGGGWLVLAAVAFGGETAGLAGRVNLLTGAGLIAVCCLSLVCWSFAWRQRMRVDGVLADRCLPVSKREARRNRRSLGRDVRRAGKLAGRSARDARRAARRSARAGGGGKLSGSVLSEGGVRSTGAGLGSASSAGEPSNMAVSYGTSLNGVNGTNGKRVGVNRSGGTSMNGEGANREGANGSAVAGVNGAAGINVNGASATGRYEPAAAGATELINQLREMLVPLLATSASQPATGSQPTIGEQTAASGLPRRTPSASAFRPRSAQISQARIPQARMPARPVSQAPVPPMAAPVADDGLGVPVDSEEAWW